MSKPMKKIEPPTMRKILRGSYRVYILIMVALDLLMYEKRFEKSLDGRSFSFVLMGTWVRAIFFFPARMMDS